MTNTALASDVRAYFTEHPEHLPEGATVGLRGRVSADLKTIFTEKTGKTVEAGSASKSSSAPAKEIEVAYRHMQPSGRTVKKTLGLTREAMRSLGVAVPERGRLSAATVEAVSDVLSAQSASTAEARGKQPVKNADQPVADVPSE